MKQDAPGNARNVLIISPLLPTFDRDSGSFRLFQLIRILSSEGHRITFIAMGAAGNLDPAPYISALESLGVKVYPIDPVRLSERLGRPIEAPPLPLERILSSTSFDFAYIYFYHAAAQYINLLRALSPGIRIIVDSVDFHYIRQKRNAELNNDAELMQQAIRTRDYELAVYRHADIVVAVTNEDKKLLLAEEPGLHVQVIPNIHPLSDWIPSFGSRTGMLFIGNFLHDPNIDAVYHLCDTIWPLVLRRLPKAQLYIVGNSPPENIKRLACENIVVTGYVPDTKVFLRKCRVSISPLRYGAGMKGKVGEALASGLPVVASAVAAEGIGLTDREHLLVEEDPASFAAAIILLNENQTIWNQFSRKGHDFMKDNFSPQAVRGNIKLLCDTITETSNYGYTSCCNSY